MFSVSENKGFRITFENGNTISVQWGPINYCDPTHPQGRNASWDEAMKSGTWEASSVEVAAWNEDGWHDFGCDTVAGWQSPAEVLKFMNFVANNELNVVKDDEDEDDESDDEPSQIEFNLDNFANLRGFATPPDGKRWPTDD